MRIYPRDNKIRIFLDLDDTLMDFSGKVGHYREHPEDMYEENFFRDLEPMPGAKDAVEALLQAGYDVHILTMPLSTKDESYTEKAISVRRHFPELVNKITMTQNKLMMKGDILIDDNKEKWGRFDGEFIHFNKYNKESEWKRIINQLLY